MHVLLIGAYGFIGSDVARGLIAHGHRVTGVGRDLSYGRRILPAVDWRQADLATMADPARWRPLLAGVDAIVNASGLLQDEAGHAVQRVQADAIIALVAAAEAAGIARFVQISAANAELPASSIFLRSKAEADRALAESSLAAVILRPGLVIGRNAYGGTELIRMAAAMPLMTPLPRATGTIQCIGMGDLVAAVVRGVEGDTPAGSHDLVEAHRRTLGDIVALHRAWLGFDPARGTVLLGGMAMGLVAGAADLFGRLGWRSPLRRNAVAALAAGISGDADGAVALLGRPALPLEAVLAGWPAGKQDRVVARLALLMPLMLAALFLLWMGSAVATFLHFDEAAGLLRAGGLDDRLARFLGGGGAVVDGLLALLMLHRRAVCFALLGTVAVTAAYLLGATIVRPDFWLDPLAPLLKVVPAAMLSLTAYLLLARR
ncbi:NAD-dependent epimerase/dehydratase [Rhizorhabdus wittichii RW1]|uniref:NAD-dependent epimerase/dehydratase n=1 Tax=Rhizorhabdus wittichii (strain DSM 6014 / CCUG 31198 / JCM 15750 / NBRC 105917 / EY 4224 / RW1) TaxID=392499 RepID=A0A9J9LF83_RHIWR|nr:NAD-dependent epimerase/dehydratase [Rhizorhabdus wittichii RW1]